MLRNNTNFALKSNTNQKYLNDHFFSNYSNKPFFKIREFYEYFSLKWNQKNSNKVFFSRVRCATKTLLSNELIFQEYGALRKLCFQMKCFFSRVRCVMKALLSNEVLFSRVRCVTRALISNEVLFSRARCVTRTLLSNEVFFFKSTVRYEGFTFK